MGFVYNNTWEAFCKTYLELHGFFVCTNLFAAMVPPRAIDDMQDEGLIPREVDAEQADMRTRKIEADLVAYRIPDINLGMYRLDSRNQQSQLGEFFAGDGTFVVNSEERPLQLVYAEVRANLSLGAAEHQIEPFFDAKRDGGKVQRMTDILGRRFRIAPLFVIMAYTISQEQKQRIAETPGWAFKEFNSMFDFMAFRMKDQYEVKKAVQYNDPFLELFRFLERRSHQKPEEPEKSVGS